MTRGEQFPERIRVERSGDELLVLDPERGLLHRVLPLDARAIAESRDLPHYAATLGPVVLDAVQRALSEQRWDRRRVLASSAVAAAAGITTVLLPSAVMALSVGGVAFGRDYENGAFLLNPQNIASTAGISNSISGGTLTGGGAGRWFVPAGITQVEILAIGTDGSEGPGREGRNGLGGTAAAVGGRFPVAQGEILLITFRASLGRGDSAGFGGAAAGVAVYRSASLSEWLVVAGGGGGGGRDGSTDPGESYVGGRGGDAGTGADAGSGQAGQYSGTGSPLSLGAGGAGATLSAPGTGGGVSVDALQGGTGGSPATLTFEAKADMLGRGGEPGNATYNGGAGGAGLYGGGAGQGVATTGVTGAGGGGSSYLNTPKLAPVSPGSTIGPFSRPREQGAYIAIYY
jgi:hypothetical protein